MHSKWRYKICICSVILGELEAFRNYKGFNVQDFSEKNLDAVDRFAKVRIFLIPLYHIFESENFRFPFLKKISLTEGVKYEQLNFRKS